MTTDQTFTRITQLPAEENFVACRFQYARLAEADAGGRTFEDCVFEDCDLSLLHVQNTAFNNTSFIRCKLQGVSFYEASHTLFSPVFKESQLHLVSFAGMPLKKMIFENCSLRGAVFTRANLTGADFKGSDLTRAVFLHTVLDKADLSAAYGFVIDPEANSLRQTRFSLYGLPGLLEKHRLRVAELEN